MSFVISSALPFPCISWWCFAIEAASITWDLAEHYEKMTYRNRYYLATANGLLKLSIPLMGGRDQHTTMKDLMVSYDDNWQKQHWRTIVSAYNRSAYFEHYSHSMEELFLMKYTSLAAFNIASVQWLMRHLGLQKKENVAEVYEEEYDGIDLRRLKLNNKGKNSAKFPHYYQVFEERNGFLPDLSLLDLLFAEGPYTLKWMQENKERIKEWAAGEV